MGCPEWDCLFLGKGKTKPIIDIVPILFLKELFKIIFSSNKRVWWNSICCYYLFHSDQRLVVNHKFELPEFELLIK